MRKKNYLSLFAFFAVTVLYSQDIHFSQFYNSPLTINPALTGIFRGDTRFNTLFKSQWASVPVDFLTFTASADTKFQAKADGNGFFAGGLNFYYDQAGASKLNLATLSLSGSYTQRISGKVFGTVGAMLSGNHRGFKLGGLTFDNQWNGEQFDPGLDPRESFDNTGITFLDFGAGLNLRFQSLVEPELVDRLDKRSKMDIGVGLFHLNRPDQSFVDNDKDNLSVRVSTYFFGTLMVSNSVDLILNLNWQSQSPYDEDLGYLGTKIHLNRELGNQLALQLGLGYRINDFQKGASYYPVIELFYNGWHASFGYDITVSRFEVATRHRGGPEFNLRYIIHKVRPLPTYKICPLI